MIAGARDAGLSPAIVGSFPRKEASLVEVLYSPYCTAGFFTFHPLDYLHNKDFPMLLFIVFIILKLLVVHICY